jgi:hypothetical protein
MKIVIQCAASKEGEAGYFMSDGQQIKFVGQPHQAPSDADYLFARPDDPSDEAGKTWRDLVADYNAAPDKNRFGLFPAYRLYSNPTYRTLVERHGVENVYILSAGWGLIRSDFLTPQYDITFSASADAYKRRKSRDRYRDFCQLPIDLKDEVVFFGGKDYLPLFCELTRLIPSKRIVFYNSKTLPDAPGCRLVLYDTTARTNWHYACVSDFVAGRTSYS